MTRASAAALRRRARQVRERRNLRHGTPSLSGAPAAGSIADDAGPLPRGRFVNPIAEGADPYVVRDGASYLWCFSDGDRGVSVARSDDLTAVGERTVVWTAPAHGPCSEQIWAPELHHLDGRWHIYLAGSDGDNRHHRAFVLVADGPDPFGPYTLHGPLATGDRPDADRWAIDMTVLEHGGRRYALWSGWEGLAEEAQHLYLAPMASPTRLAGPRVLISDSRDFEWERVPEPPGHPATIDEAPQVLRRGERTFVLFSASSALTASYAMGVLELVGDDPLDPAAWRKHPRPVLAPTPSAPGVGHGLVIKDGDGAPWLVFHAKIGDDVSFRRGIHVQPAAWTTDGFPDFGAPAPRYRSLLAPASLPAHTEPAYLDLDLDPAGLLHLADYYGHHQLVSVDSTGLRLGRVPRAPVNAYRSAEKLVVRTTADQPGPVEVVVDVTLPRSGSFGVLLRVTGAAVGVDALRGYHLGYDARGRSLLVDRFDGDRRVRLAALAVPGGPRGGAIRLVADAAGADLSIRLDAHPATVLRVRDEVHPSGAVGLRVARFEATVRRLRLTAGEQ